MEKQQLIQKKRGFVVGSMILSVLCLLAVVVVTTIAMSAIDDDIEFLKEYGGWSQTLFLEGDLAYIGRGAYLVIVDITDPTNPVEIGRSVNLPDMVTDIQVVDNLAYIANRENGLVIMDVNNPISLTVVSSLQFQDDIGRYTQVNAVTVVGNVAYLGTDGLVTVDVSDPNNLTMLAQLDLDGSFVGADIEVVNNTAYVGSISVHGIDVTDPANPIIRSQYTPTEGNIKDMDIVDNILYVALGNGGLDILDVSDPTRLPLYSRYGNEYISAVEVRDDVAYFLQKRDSTGRGELIQLDVSDSRNPTRLQSSSLSVSGFEDIDLAGDLVYVIDMKEGMRIVDISEPLLPVEVGVFGSGDVVDGFLSTIEGNIAYFAANEGIRMVDISDPAELSVLGVVNIDLIEAMAVQDGIAYVSNSNGIGNELIIIDVNDPAAPNVLGSFTFDVEVFSDEIIVDNGFVYVRDKTKGMYIADVTDLSNPVQVGAFETTEFVWLNGMRVVENIAYLATNNGLHIVDMSDRSAPLLLGSHKTDTRFSDVDVVDTVVYALRSPSMALLGGIEILDFTDPQLPVEIGSISDFFGVEDIHVADGVAYVSESHIEIRAVDVSDPANPTMIRSLNFAPFIDRFHVKHGYMYLSGYATLYIYQLRPDAGVLPPPPPIDPIISTAVITEPIALDVRSGLEDVLLRWQVVEPLEGVLDHYNVYRYQLGTIITPILLSSQVGSHYVDMGGEVGFTAGDSYCYYVEAIDDGGEIITASNITCTEFGELLLSVPHVVLPPDGTRIPVPVTVLNGNNLCLISMDITLVYDARLVTAVDVQPTAYTAGYQFEASTQQPGRVSIASITNECQPLAGSGALFDILFDVRGDVGAISALNFTEGLTATAIYNDGENTPTVMRMTNGSLTVGTDATRGDISEDGVVNAFDAFTALEVAAGSIDPSLQQTISCDVNGDGSCNAADSSLILCYAAHEAWGICDPTVTTRSAKRQVVTTLTKGGLTAGKLPIMLQSGTDVSGGTVTFNYDPTLIQVNGIDTANSLLANWTVTTDEEAGLLRVAFADSEPVSSDGTLFTINATPLVEGATVQWAGAQFNDELGLDWESNLGHNIVYADSGELVPLSVSVVQQTAWSAVSFVGILMLLLCGLTGLSRLFAPDMPPTVETDGYREKTR